VKTTTPREQKKGLLKLALLETALDLIKQKSFDEITVKEICLPNNISEVTFFTYFEKKNDILRFFMLIWNFMREVQMHQHGRPRGLEGIYSLFEDIAATDNSLVIMVSLISYISKLQQVPEKTKLTGGEIYALFPELPAAQLLIPMELEAQLELHIKQANEKEEIPTSMESEALVSSLSSLFYGMPLIVYMKQENDLKKAYSQALDIIFKKRQDG